jgi:cytochrome c551/c552
MSSSRFVPLLLLALFSGTLTRGETPAKPLQPSSEQVEFFESKIRPLLANNCFTCHGSTVQAAGLNFSTAATFFKGAESGPVVVKGEPENSRLIQVVGYHGTIKMPPAGKLKDSEIADLVAWVKMGAPWADAGVIPPAPERRAEHKFSREQKAFWAFQPVRDNPPPTAKNGGWAQSPVDRFILAELESKGLAPAKAADRLTLLRRATFDLTGLPPTVKEIEDFLADGSPDAFAKVVDRLLASPRYGERWGRHWLDVARYADSAGADEDIRYPYAYRYRDYVVDALNQDLPYDEFIKQQLAGDLLPPDTPGGVNVKGIVATGFLQVGPKLLAEQDKPKMVYDMVDEQLDVTSRAFMGLTVGCARCHDHKFDPIPTKDYYSMASIFASTKSLSKVEGTVSQLLFVPLVPKDVTERYNQHQAKIKAKSEQIQEIVDSEAAKYAAALRPDLARYMLASWQYENRPKSLSSLKVEEFARQQELERLILESWISYLKPSPEVRPHLRPWFQAVEGASKLQPAPADGPAVLPQVPAQLAEAAKAYQKQFQQSAEEWEDTLAKWRIKAKEALSLRMDPPEKPKVEGGKHRFFAEVYFGKGPFALPEENPERLFSDQSRATVTALRSELDSLKKNSPPEPPMACAVEEGPSIQQRVFIRGNVANPGEEVPKQFLQIIAGESQTPVTKGSGRLELAEWLTKPDHPLTARVIVNRVWQWHFGEGLVRTPGNFGKLGEAPTHPGLLDYLARQFIEKGWSIKAIHRLIMLSSTYQMSSDISKKATDMDPSNRLLARMNRRRLDVEEIRDGLLAISGELDFTVGGTLQAGFGTDEENSNARLSFDPDSTKRRTVYLPLRRSNLPSLLNLFDFGDATTPGEGRARTNIASQALYMMNSQFVSDRARELARNLLADPIDDDRRRIEAAHLLILGRRPGGDEVQNGLDYIKDYEKKGADLGRVRGAVPTSKLEAWQSFCHILMSSNEFIYVD